MTERRVALGVVGNDAPRQLLLAAGARPVRLTGTWDGPIDPEAADLLGAADPVAARILTELRTGTADLGGLIVCNDSQAHLRLYYVLRATMPTLPLLLLDLPRDDSAPVRAFLRHQFEALLDFCVAITGHPVDGADLAEAAVEERALGAALERLAERRRASNCSGAAGLAAQLEAGRLDPADAVRVIDAATRPVAGRRVHLTGSSHPDPSVYRALERHRIHIVSDDHDTGDGAWLGVAADGTDAAAVIDGLVGAHLARVTGSARALAADRAEQTARLAQAAGAEAVGAFIRVLDDAPRWDLADQTAALEPLGIPLRVLANVGPDAAGAADELAAVLLETELGA